MLTTGVQCAMQLTRTPAHISSHSCPQCCSPTQHRLPPPMFLTLTAVVPPLPLTPSLSPAPPAQSQSLQHIVPVSGWLACPSICWSIDFSPCWVNWVLWLARPPSDLLSAAGARLLGFAFLTSDLSFLFPLISLLRFLHWSCSNDSELALDCRALTTWYKFSISWILIRFKQITQLIQHFKPQVQEL